MTINGYEPGDIMEAATQTATETNATPATKTFYAGGINAPASQKMLKRLSKATKESPLRAKSLKGQYPNRIVRMLVSLGYGVQKRDDNGIFFLPNRKTAKAIAN